MRISSKIAAALAVALLTVSCGSSDDGDAPASDAADCASFDDVTFRLSFLPFAEHLPIVVANEIGAYEDHCINVEILQGQGSTFAVQVVGTGSEDFGNAAPGSVLNAAAEGIPVVSIADLYVDSGQALFATAESGITGPEDLAGHRIGVFPGSFTQIALEALLAQQGIEDGDVELITVSPGSDLPLVLDGTIEAEVTLIHNEITEWQIANPDLELNVWELQDLGLGTPGQTIITSQTMVDENPELVERFVAATLAGMEYAVANPAESIDLFVDAFPDAGINGEAEAAKWEILSGWVVSDGRHDTERWQALEDLMIEYEGLTERVLGDGAVLTDEFLPNS